MDWCGLSIVEQVHDELLVQSFCRNVIVFLTSVSFMHHYLMRGTLPRSSLSRTLVLPPLPLHRFCAPRLPSLFKAFSLHYPRLAPTMDDNIKQHYLADSPPTVVRLEIKSHFDSLQDDGLRKYAHYMSR